MTHKLSYTLLPVLLIAVFTGCNSKNSESEKTAPEAIEGEVGHTENDQNKEGMTELHLSDQKVESLGIILDTLPLRSLSELVESTGQLEVPPQYEATVTAILGANVTSIKVLEGEKVSKGQVLAFLSHPNLTNLQTQYVKSYSGLQYVEQEMQRQKRLYEEKVASGKTYQETLADYQSIKAEVKGYESHLKQLNLSIDKVQTGDIYQHVPVVSPITGYIEKVTVQLGQFVDPQTELFSIVNTEHIHADLMVFEKDVYKVQAGQQVTFTVESVPGVTLTANIQSVGKRFEQKPKAVHVHAEIDQKEDFLIPGMYINGKISTKNNDVTALPQEAVVEENGKSYIFIAEPQEEGCKTGWGFSTVEVRTGNTDDGWVEIKLMAPLPEGTSHGTKLIT